MESRTRLEIGSLHRVERAVERTVGQKGTQRAELGAVVVAVAERAGAEQAGIVGLSERFGEVGERMVGDVVFERV